MSETPTNLNIQWGGAKGSRLMPAHAVASLTYTGKSAMLRIRYSAADALHHHGYDSVQIGVDVTLRVLAIKPAKDGRRRQGPGSLSSTGYSVPKDFVGLLGLRPGHPIHATRVWVDDDVVYVQFPANEVEQ